MKQKSTCPSRVNEFGPWERGEGLDAWETDRWGTKLGRAISWWYHNGPIGNFLRQINRALWERGWHGLRNRLPNPYQGGTQWRWPRAPRTCSFCGCAHPDDVIQLLEEGWRLERTTKGYKHYVEPPRSSGWSPVPPVKLYGARVSEAQVDRINVAMRKGRHP